MTTRPSPSRGRAAVSRRHPARVVLIDRDRAVRDAVADLLELDPAVTVVGHADTLERALTLLPELDPDVIVLDPHLPDGDGLDVCRQLKAANSPTRCLILTADLEPDAVLVAVDAGATGYVIKDLTELALADAVKTLAAGHSHLDHHTTLILMRELRLRAQPTLTRNPALTTMETTIMLLLAQGLTHRQISDRLFFTENTIRNYAARITRKLNNGNRNHIASRSRDTELVVGDGK